MRWYLILSICISPIISKVEHLFIFLLATCILSYFKSYCHWKTLNKKNNLPRLHQQSLTFIYAIFQALASSVSESVLTLSSCMVILKYSICLTATKALSSGAMHKLCQTHCWFLMWMSWINLLISWVTLCVTCALLQ